MAVSTGGQRWELEFPKVALVVVGLFARVEDDFHHRHAAAVDPPVHLEVVVIAGKPHLRPDEGEEDPRRFV